MVPPSHASLRPCRWSACVWVRKYVSARAYSALRHREASGLPSDRLRGWGWGWATGRGWGAAVHGERTEVVADGPVVHREEARALQVSGQHAGLQQGLLRLGSGHRAPAPADVNGQLPDNPYRASRGGVAEGGASWRTAERENCVRAGCTFNVSSVGRGRKRSHARGRRPCRPA
jgi:hypothetical protein